MHFLQDEGFYVQASTSLQRNTTKLEVRIRESEGEGSVISYFRASKWFGPSQELLVTSIPLNAFSNRPKNSITALEYLNSTVAQESVDEIPQEPGDRYVKFKPEVEPNQYKDEIDVSVELKKAGRVTKYKEIDGASSYKLLLDIHSVNLKDHPYMTEEIRLSKECMEMIHVLRERQKSGIVSFLDRKLTALKNAHMDFKMRNAVIEESKQNLNDGIYPAKPDASYYTRHESEERKAAMNESEIQQTNRNFLEDIRATRILRDTETQTDLVLEFSILKKWERIKHLRVKQGYTTGTLKVMVKAIPNAYDEVYF